MQEASVYITPLLVKYPRLLRNRNFLLLWSGSVVSSVGDRVHMVVMLALLSQIMGRILGQSGYKAGTMEHSQLTVIMFLPFLVLGPFTGALADRMPRRFIMIMSDLARMAIIIVARSVFLGNSVRMSNSAQYALLLFTEFSVASFAAAFLPARLALLPQLVHPDQLLRANSLTSAAGTIASLLGFLIGGLLLAKSIHVAMFVDAGTFFGSAVCLFFIKNTALSEVSRVETVNRPTVGKDLMIGLRYIRTHRRVLEIMLMLLVFWSCGAIILNGLTGLVTRYYGLSISQYAMFMGVISLGMIAGAGSVSAISLLRRELPKEIGIAGAMLAMGASLLTLSFQSHWLPGLVCATAGAGCGIVLLISLDTLLQRIVPNFVRGRVMGVKYVVTTVGLIGMTLPLAFWPSVNDYIRFLIMGLAAVVVLIGFWLLALYRSV